MERSAPWCCNIRASDARRFEVDTLDSSLSPTSPTIPTFSLSPPFIVRSLVHTPSQPNNCYLLTAIGTAIDMTGCRPGIRLPRPKSYSKKDRYHCGRPQCRWTLPIAVYETWTQANRATGNIRTVATRAKSLGSAFPVRRSASERMGRSCLCQRLWDLGEWPNAGVVGGTASTFRARHAVSQAMASTTK